MSASVEYNRSLNSNEDPFSVANGTTMQAAAKIDASQLVGIA